MKKGLAAFLSFSMACSGLYLTDHKTVYAAEATVLDVYQGSSGEGGAPLVQTVKKRVLVVKTGEE